MSKVHMQAYLIDAGKISYEEGLRLQNIAFNARAEERLQCDVLFLLEHKPVITMGQLASDSNLRVSIKDILKQGVEYCQTTRSGRATYHGPGQIVGYPIVDFTCRKNSICPLTEKNYSEKLEHVMISVGQQYAPELFKRKDKDPETQKRYVGAWCRQGNSMLKVGAVGWALKHAHGHMISQHGFALNVDITFPEHFELIDPCGLKGVKAASLSDLCGREISVAEVKEKVALEFSKVFGYEFEQMSVAEFMQEYG